MSMQQTILVIEDDAAIRRGITDALRFSGFEVLGAADGREGLHRIGASHYDLVLLDLILPGASGFEILQHLQRDRAGVPVIILSALGEEADRVKGLRLGADDYVVKPFSVVELLARVEAVLRRSPERNTPQDKVPFPEGVIDFSFPEIRYHDGSRCDLSQKEAALLKYLVEHTGRAISRDELLHRIWGLDGRKIETRTVDMHMVHLRSKLRDSASPPRFLLTIRSKGYTLKAGFTS
jgi:DNA-binding response OmpR family regulator